MSQPSLALNFSAFDFSSDWLLHNVRKLSRFVLNDQTQRHPLLSLIDPCGWPTQELETFLHTTTPKQSNNSNEAGRDNYREINVMEE